jgi:hypothetical protein
MSFAQASPIPLVDPVITQTLFSILPIMVSPWHSVRMTVLADALLAFIEVGDPGATEFELAPDVEPDQEWGVLLDGAHVFERATITLFPAVLYVMIDLPPASQRGGVSIVISVTPRAMPTIIRRIELRRSARPDENALSMIRQGKSAFVAKVPGQGAFVLPPAPPSPAGKRAVRRTPTSLMAPGHAPAGRLNVWVLLEAPPFLAEDQKAQTWSTGS